MIDPWTMTVGRRLDWKTERERVDLAAVATGLLGPAPGRRGERGGKLWWRCPFHADAHPSFTVTPGKPWWRCFGCGEKGDAATLVMKLRGLTFPEAVAFLTGGSALVPRKPTPRPSPQPEPKAPAAPSGPAEADAVALVEAAAAMLWTAEGSEALAYLTGPTRCLTPETIRAARLGWTSWTTIPKADGSSFKALGIVIPWFDDLGRLALVKIRQPDDRRPKYVEAFRDPARLVCYPAPATIRPGRPLVIVEGELDCVLLARELGDLSAVVTLGSASARPEPRARLAMLAAPRWFVATDADAAGDRSAEGWSGRRVRRVRPPEPYKDWSEAKAGGVCLARWWRDVLNGVDRPALFTWEELSSWRWGPTVGDPGVDRPATEGA